jgi:hypothetical protein
MTGRNTIAIVGNGDIGYEVSRAVDAADFVVRFNDCRSFDGHGGRTDAIAVCNTGRPGKTMLAAESWQHHPAVVAASEIWSVRDPGKFAALRPDLAVSHPELDDFCDDYTEDFAAFAATSGKRHVIIDQAIHEATDAALRPFDPGRYVVPSSGLIVIAHLLAARPADDIVIAGFGHVGWDGHPFAAERLLVESYIAAGWLKRLEDGVQASQGMEGR